MKKVKLILTSVFAIVSVVCFSQTTQEEYNYITKGYKVQIESGLDMKKGYSFKDLQGGKTTKGSEKRSCSLKALYRDGSDKACAIMIIYKRTDISDGVQYYFCVPSMNADEEMWDLAFRDMTSKIGSTSPMMDKTIIWGLMKALSQAYTE